MTRARLRAVGGSVMLAVPRALLDQIRADVGTELDIGVEEGRLVIAPIRVFFRYQRGNGNAHSYSRLGILDHFKDQGAFGKVDPAALHLAMIAGNGSESGNQAFCFTLIDIDGGKGHHPAPDTTGFIAID